MRPRRDESPEPLRTLPIKVAPLPGEALDSWLEAIAVRYGCDRLDALLATGLPAGPRSRYGTPWLFGLSDSELISLGAVTGVRGDDLQAMTLAHFTRVFDFDLLINHQPPVGLPSNSRSRFCPRCLQATSGRWQLAWRLGWCFVCLDHRCLLVDTCPSCGNAQRCEPLTRRETPVPGACTSHARLGGQGRCGYDLCTATTLTFPQGHPVLRAQSVLSALLGTDEAMFGVYTDRPRRVHAALADFGAVAELALAYPEQRELAKHLPADLLALYVEHGPFPAHKFRSNRRTYPAPPATALTAAVGAVIGMQILGQPNVAAASREMRWLLRRLGPRGPAVRGRATIDNRPHTTDVLGEVQKKALAPLASPRDQLHYRRDTDFPSVPAIPPAAYDRMVQSIRSELWPDWAVRIAPRKSGYAVPAALACAILVVGSNASVPDTVADLGSVISPLTANRILVQLSRARHWKTISTAVLRLSNYLAEHPAPIDYTRRRAIDYTDLLPPSQWYEICRDADTRRGADPKLWFARYYLYEMLSGKPARTFPHPPTWVCCTIR